MKRKERKPEIHFYEWSVSRWVQSQAREELNAIGRSIYREMLDSCYTQGSVTSDLGILARKCACTPAEIESQWAIIRRYFHQDKHDSTRLHNKDADVYRKNYFAFLKRQRKNRSKSVPEKPNGVTEMGDGGATTVAHTRRDNTIRDDTRQDETTTTTPPTLAGAELQQWPQSVRAMQELHPDTDSLMARRIVACATPEDPELTDDDLARGLGLTHKRNQESAALWLYTIPAWVRNTRSQRRGSPRKPDPQDEAERIEEMRRALEDPDPKVQEWARQYLKGKGVAA